MRKDNVAEIEVRGKTYQVGLSSGGEFTVELDGETVKSPSMVELRSKLARLTNEKSKKIAIEFYRWRNGVVNHGVVTGRHATNRNYLVKLDGQKGDQEGRWNGTEYLNLTTEEVSKYQALCEAEQAAIKAAEEFREAHQIDMKAAVEAAYGTAPEED